MMTSDLRWRDFHELSDLILDNNTTLTMIHFLLLFSRQGKLRLQKWFEAYPVCSTQVWNDVITLFVGQSKEEDHSRADRINLDQESQDVFLHRVAGSEDSVQEVRQSLLLHRGRRLGQWTTDPGDHSQICGASWQIFWKCKQYYNHWCMILINLTPGLWTGHHLQLWKGLLHAGWVVDWWRDSGDEQEECSQSYCCARFASRRRQSSRAVRGHWAWIRSAGSTCVFSIKMILYVVPKFWK